MKKFIFLVITIILLLACSTEYVEAQVSSAMPKTAEIKADNRAQILRQFLAGYDSKLIDSAEDFVVAADFYGLDYRMLPAISGIESTFGKQMIDGTYNAYGWGGGTIRFDSWSDGIWTISEAINEKYIAKGANNIHKIGRIYCPPNPQWAYKVDSFMQKIDKTAALTPNL